MSNKKLACIFTAILFALMGMVHSSVDLRTGDILLVPMKCRVCRLIEEEESTKYSHVGIVYRDGTKNGEDNEIYVFESWGKVRRIPFRQFLEKSIRDIQTRIAIYRSIEAISGFPVQHEMWAVFKNEFDGLPYDEKFLWNNNDHDGREKLYCSEFVVKFLNRFLANQIQPIPMHYDTNRDEWARYFQGPIPDGLPGISPAYFEHSPLFFYVGEFSSSSLL